MISFDSRTFCDISSNISIIYTSFSIKEMEFLSSHQTISQSRMHTIVKVARSRLAYQNVLVCSRISKLSSQSVESETGGEDVPDPLAAKDEEIAALQAKLTDQDKLLSDMKNKYLRALADGENVRNRSKKEIEDSKIFSIQSFAKVSLQPLS